MTVVCRYNKNKLGVKLSRYPNIVDSPETKKFLETIRRGSFHTLWHCSNLWSCSTLYASFHLGWKILEARDGKCTSRKKLWVRLSGMYSPTDRVFWPRNIVNSINSEVKRKFPFKFLLFYSYEKHFSITLLLWDARGRDWKRNGFFFIIFHDLLMRCA